MIREALFREYVRLLGERGCGEVEEHVCASP
jgi:hypothetical protein